MQTQLIPVVHGVTGGERGPTLERRLVACYGGEVGPEELEERDRGFQTAKRRGVVGLMGGEEGGGRGGEGLVGLDPAFVF